MRIVATILSGNSEEFVAESISSVREFVDQVLLIDTGITDGSRAIAQVLLGERLNVESFEEQKGTFNFIGEK